MRTSHRNSRRLLALVAAGLLVLGLSACGGDDDDDNTAATTETTGGEATTGGGGGGGLNVTIKAFAFTDDASPTAGGEIKVENQDGVTHTFTSDDGEWESIEISGGDTGTTTAPSAPGEYKFHCEIHKSMTGTLTVE
ncbi:MAG TPA: cupredoxin domain-containing protein [Acidimicrobiia bacterium]|nr:cupredoxin domain-containing protein [Acidimicrobiia bacterium]